MNIANSTISGNLTNEDGGGIRSAGTLNLTHVTITDNVADGDTIQIIGDGGGLYCSFCKVKIKNSIIARNTDRSGGGADCSGSFELIWIQPDRG